MKKIRKILAVSLVMMLALIPANAFAGSLNLDVSGTDSCKAGDEFMVSVTYSSDYFDQVSGVLEYDDSMVDYISGGSSQGSGGEVALKGYSDDGQTVSFNLVFKALKGGDVNLNISTREAYDLDGKAYAEKPSTGFTVTVEEEQEPDPEDRDDDDDDGDVDDDDDDDNGSTVIDDGNNTEGDGGDTPDDTDRGTYPLAFIALGIGALILVFIIGILVGIRRRR